MLVELTAGADDAGRRLDRILRKSLPDHSLSLIHRLLRQGKVRIGGKKAGAETRVQAGDVIQVVLQDGPTPPPARKPPMPKADLPKVSLPKVALPPILWQGSGIIVFNKPAGLASHGNDSLDTLVNVWLAEKLPPSLSFKPGPLHRLDKPTSGIIAFSQTLAGAQLFTRLLREGKIKKTYLAVVEGTISGEQTWQDTLVRNKTAQKTFVESAPHKGATALTTIRPVATNGTYTLIEADIATGRTHQIRSQCAAHGHPLAGDVKYGGKKLSGGFYLHAWKLDAGGYLENFLQPLVAPLPERFEEFVREELSQLATYAAGAGK